ncbi:hypothetical protein Z517_11202 [Fonsecaea pedrosoi CBS 271.37]|uniref:Uncharacterized protein n=1 Tax=Fonsecaea pedrosoi CBS 271.37 TaxID=1442368 RepID=A0A0D2DFH6_9EURO|nr:uncharacterized protein Z517_11202 [Fonsecaea pedrosoi CBS 271.37]KIW76456.1 hypothetical protein Z517_11202 [Fonsecaea pedrosoi CBS 271.37]
MAAGVVERDISGARKGHDKPGLQQVKPDRSISSIIIKSFGFDTYTNLLLNLPSTGLPAIAKAGLLIVNYITGTAGCGVSLLYSWTTANFAGHTKKVTISALVLISFYIGHIIGPKTFRDADALDYIPAKLTIVIILSVGILATVALNWAYWHENKKRDREEPTVLPDDFEFIDLTDKENRNFRYIL